MEKINKIKSCIQVWKKRDLTIKGRILIIKTLLVSQIGFEVEMRTIPKHILKTIEALIWQFLLNDKKALVNRNTMYLRPEDGGQNMINLTEFIKSKRIKLAYKVIHSSYENWNIICKYWFKKFDEKYSTEYFLYKCSSLRNLNLEFLPKFYHDVITAYAYMQSKAKIHDIDSILDENIFGNSNIIFSHAPLWFESFSKSGFKKIKDIWDSAHKTFHSEIDICNRLADKTNWRIYYNRIKSRIPKNWVEKLESNATHAKVTNILKVKDSIYMYNFKNEFTQPIKLTNKQLQRYLRDVNRPKCELKWETYFNETFNWRKVWKLSLDLPCSNKEKQFHWKIIHNALFTESKMQLMGMSNGSCHFCKTDSETLHHLFYQCRITQNFILKVENALNILLRNKLNVAAIKIQLKH